MELITSIVSQLNGIVWGWFTLALVLGVGLYLSLGLKFLTLRKIPTAFSLLVKKDTHEGQIQPFQALMTSLSATIGTGNIAGVATAVFLGGPGALFWMWITALVGMATKYAEAVCAVKFRETDALGNYVGGPMYYIKNGLGPKWKWLAIAFAIFGSIAGFGIGNGVQSNSVASVLNSQFGIDTWITGAVLAVIVGGVILGGIKRISHVASFLVPIMGLAYLSAGLFIVISNASELPAVFNLIIDSAFNGAAAQGGFAGAAVMAAIRFGVARGVFSNEAGLGSAPIAHAAAKTNSPVKQGYIAMLGTFIDTLIICSVTGLVILLSGEWTSGVNGAALSANAFNALLPGGNYVINIALPVFAFTTIIGWSYYCERCVEFLLGVKAIMPFRVLWVVAVFAGTVVELEFIWLLADTLNALMALPNLIALLLLSPIIFKLTKEFHQSKQS